MIRAFVLFVLLVPSIAFAQNAQTSGTQGPSTAGPLVIERVHNPFIVAPDYKVTDLDGELGHLAGGYVGRAIEDTLFVGGGGYWLANGSRGDELAYAGAIVGWSMPAGSRIRFGARGLVGGGRATLGTDIDRRTLDVRGGGLDPRGRVRFGEGPRGVTTAATGQPTTLRVRARDDFFVFEPQADLLTRLTRHIALNWAAGYRLTAATDVLDDRINGVTGSVAMQFQW
jgi:hypothetical protein